MGSNERLKLQLDGAQFTCKKNFIVIYRGLSLQSWVFHVSLSVSLHLLLCPDFFLAHTTPPSRKRSRKSHLGTKGVPVQALLTELLDCDVRDATAEDKCRNNKYLAPLKQLLCARHQDVSVNNS